MPDLPLGSLVTSSTAPSAPLQLERTHVFVARVRLAHAAAMLPVLPPLPFVLVRAS